MLTSLPAERGGANRPGRMARVAQGVHFNPSPLILAALLYLALLWPLVRLIRRLGGRAVLPA